MAPRVTRGQRWARTAATVVASMVLAGGATVAVRAITRPRTLAPRATLAPWPLPDRPGDRIRAAHLPSYHANSEVQHLHVHLDIVVAGAAVTIPAEIGLAPPYSPVHTHSQSGVIHIETDAPSASVTLGDFFTVWGVALSPRCLGGYCAPSVPRVYLNGEAHAGPPRQIRLRDGDEIAIIVGETSNEGVPQAYGCATAAPVELESCRRSFRVG